MKRFLRQYTPFIIIFLAICSLFALSVATNAPPSLAHPDGPAHHNPLPEHANDVMKKQRADAQPPQNLQALATTDCVGGLAGVYPCNNVDLEAFMPLADIGGYRSNSAANDSWGWTDSASGREFAIVGRVFGTSFVEITDPTNPVYLGELVTHGAFGSSWRDIKTYANHAFIVSEANQHGMQVFDLTQLLNVSNPPVTFAETAHYNGNAQAHNIVINEGSGYAYIVGASGKNNCSGGLHMVNIQNPTNPTFAGCFSADGYTHDAQCVNYNGPDADHQGQEICINSNEDTVTIVDVSTKSAPAQISRTGYSGSAYTHQGWLTEDQTYFLLDDELDEQNFGHNTRTRVWDVSDLDAPQLIATFDGTTAAIDHNQYIKGNYSYQADYRAGLRILDISNISSPTEVAYFDIYPADNSANFNAAWSNYPYFNSGIVVVSGIEQGLFILRPNLGSNPTPTPTNTPVPPTPTNTPVPPTPTNTPVPPTPTNTPVPPTPTNTPVPGLSLSVNAYKVKGVQHADLTWSGATSTDVDIYRDDVLIVTTANDGEHTDNIGQKGGNVTYTYRVCEAGTTTCSNDAAASF